jgi:outer membrane protein OmpA-like peptidoglycan-associated protein
MKGFLVIIFMICASSTHAQRVATDYGDIYFEFFQFKEAIKYYDEALRTATKPNKIQYLNEQLSQCYKYLFQYQKAETYFAKIMTSGLEVKPEFYIDYGNILKLNGKYKQAKEQFKKYQEVAGTELAEPFIKSVNWAIRNSDTIRDYDIFPTDLNISGQALGYCYYDDGLLYSHSRNKPSLGKSQTPLFDLDYSRIVSNVDFEPDLKLMELIQLDLNEGSPSVSSDGMILYFSANSTDLTQGKSKTKGKIQATDEGVSNFKIYAAVSEGGMFQNPVPLPFNDEDFSCIHPCISIDGNVLFFSSDMPGGFGGFDLYKSIKEPKGTWSEPINMGKVVNTEENELFPWVNNDLIFFSSKGFNNYGGYDIFVAKLNKLGLPNSLKNIGQPINSFRDDIAYITKDGGRSGYFSSNRDNEEGNDFVYYVNEITHKNNEEVLTIDSDSLANLKIEGSLNVNNNKVSSPIGTSNELNAAVLATTPVIAAGAIIPSSTITEKLNSKSSPIIITAGNANEDLNRRFTSVEFKFNDASINESQMQTADSIVALLNANNGLKVFIAAHADSRGGFEYNLKLTDKRSIAVKRYIMNRGIPSSRIITRGFGESQLLNNCADGISCSEAEHAVNRRVEMKLVR